ncbi:hypothetical protein BBH99_18720 [Chryseobacterium contaminans]|nr:hypothetical protein [Chryseobacterium contaminans]OCA79510.1 hypothetical protein BBH99_18720 [Chryseobacterium contaminans]
MAATGKIDPEKVQNIIDYLTKTYQEPTVETKKSFLFTTYHYTWILDDRLIQIVTGKKLEEQNLNHIISEKDKKQIQEIEKDNLAETHLYICSKTYVDQLKGKLISGNWSDFK